MSFTGISLIATTKSTGSACALSIGKKVIFEIIKKKYNKYKKRQFEKDQISNKSFDKLYRKSLQDNVIDKSEYESLCNNFTNHLDETKFESFL